MKSEFISRRSFLKASLASTAALGLPSALTASYAEPAQRKPNIIYIMADDLGYGDLGCYGQKILKTPNIDKLAREGMRFTDCYAGSTVCAPSRCCLMTGKHTGNARIRGNSSLSILPEDVTVAEVLKTAGYKTGIVGKWGLGQPESVGIPNKKGFDYWFGYLNQRHAHNYYPSVLWENTNLYFPKVGEYSHDLFTEKAMKFISDNHKNPFFLYLSYTIPHANNQLGRAKGDGMEVPSYYEYEKENWPSPEKGFAAMIKRLDIDIGRIMIMLKRLRIDEDTIVFFTSDNGPHSEGCHDYTFFDSNGPLRGFKRDLYEGGIRVPMIVRWPGKVAAGTQSNIQWAFWDFPDTACELASAGMPDGLDGISMLPAILGKDQKEHKYLYWEFYERGFKQAVRMGKWKGVRLRYDQPIELYDLSSDIGEKDNIAEKHPEIVKKIEGIMKTARTESKDFPSKR